MKLCPIAIAVGCRKCPIFSVCPVKAIIGDHKKKEEKKSKSSKVKKPASKNSKVGKPAPKSSKPKKTATKTASKK